MEFTVQITEDEYKAVADHVVSVEGWLQTAISEKAANCIDRLLKKESQRLLDDPSVDIIPGTKEALLYSYFNQSGYKNRVERDAESEL